MTRQLEIAAWCNVVRDGEQKTSAAGNSYGVVVLSADSGNTDDAGKPVPAFMRVFAFGPLTGIAANLRKGNKVYLEGTLSVGIWTTNDGVARPDLSVKASKLEPTTIGKSRQRREDRQGDYQRPLEREPERPPFEDSVPF